MKIHVSREENLNTLLSAQKSGGWCYSTDRANIQVANGFFGKLIFIIKKTFNSSINKENLDSAVLNILPKQESEVINTIINGKKINDLLNNKDLSDLILKAIKTNKIYSTYIIREEFNEREYLEEEYPVCHPLLKLAEKISNTPISLDKFYTPSRSNHDERTYLSGNFNFERTMSAILSNPTLESEVRKKIEFVKKNYKANLFISKNQSEEMSDNRYRNSFNSLVDQIVLLNNLPPELDRFKKDCVLHAAYNLRQGFLKELGVEKSGNNDALVEEYISAMVSSLSSVSISHKKELFKELTTYIEISTSKGLKKFIESTEELLDKSAETKNDT